MSDHRFDGENISADLHAQPYKLHSKVIPSEQYNNFDYAEVNIEGFDAFDNVWNTLAPIIGTCIIVYSELETSLERNLYEMLSGRSDQFGMLIARQLTYIQKVNLYIDLLRSHPEQGDEFFEDVSMLKKHLIRAAEIRNIIAHAKWPSITADGFVFSSVDAINAEQGMPELRYYSLNKESLDLSFDYISAVAGMPHYIHETYLEY